MLKIVVIAAIGLSALRRAARRHQRAVSAARSRRGFLRQALATSANGLKEQKIVRNRQDEAAESLHFIVE